MVFIGEIHRFSKAADALLPHVERGTDRFDRGDNGRTRRFEVIAPLLSRSRVLTLESLDEGAIGALIDRALVDPSAASADSA